MMREMEGMKILLGQLLNDKQHVTRETEHSPVRQETWSKYFKYLPLSDLQESTKILFVSLVVFICRADSKRHNRRTSISVGDPGGGDSRRCDRS